MRTLLLTSALVAPLVLVPAFAQEAPAVEEDETLIEPGDQVGEPDVAAEGELEPDPDVAVDDPIEPDPDVAADDPAEPDPDVAVEPIEPDPDVAADDPAEPDPDVAVEPIEPDPDVAVDDPVEPDPDVAVDDPADPDVAVDDPAEADPDVAVDDPAEADPDVAVDDPAEADPEVAVDEPEEPRETIVRQQAPNELRVDWITGTTVTSSQDETIGQVNDLIIDQETSEITAAIIGVGGFLGIGTKSIAVAFEELQIDFDAREITLNLSREEADAAPEYEFRERADAPAAADPGMGEPAPVAPLD